MTHENRNDPNPDQDFDLEASLSAEEKEKLKDLDAQAYMQEELRLLAAQGEEALTLEALGIADKARVVLRWRHAGITEQMKRQGMEADSSDEPVLDGPDVHVAVALLREKRSGGVVIEKPAIRFSTSTESSSGHMAVSHMYVDMHEGVPAGSGEKPVPVYDFTPEEIEVAEGILAKRRQDYENGLFPHLNPDMAGLFDPSTAMRAIPPRPES